MKVFISWSGEESRQIAEALRDWLPMAVHATKPYMSARDNEAGSRWADVVAGELNATDFGLLCLTPSNIEAPWIHFEAGALGKAVTTARVVPLLHRLDASDVAPPLSQFMMKPLDRAGTLDTVRSINKGLGSDARIEDIVLEGSFNALWPSLEARIAGIEPPSGQEDLQPRPDREILEEILDLVRQVGNLEPLRPQDLWFQDPWLFTERKRSTATFIDYMSTLTAQGSMRTDSDTLAILLASLGPVELNRQQLAAFKRLLRTLAEKEIDTSSGASEPATE